MSNVTDQNAPSKASPSEPIRLDIEGTSYPIGIFNKDQSDESFYLGRKDQISRLVNILTMSAGHSSTLVTGHRGSGKTSFVYECIRRTKSLGILRFLQESKIVRWANIFLVVMIIFSFDSILTNFIANFVKIKSYFSTLITLFSILITYAVTRVFNRRKERFHIKNNDINQSTGIFLRNSTILVFALIGLIPLGLFGIAEVSVTGFYNDFWAVPIYGIAILFFVSFMFHCEYKNLFQKQFKEAQPLQSRFTDGSRRTFFYGFLRFWTPLLVVHANLGFNNISHKTVINALLTGLRHEYSSTFLSPLRLRFWVFLLLPLWIAVYTAGSAENWYVERIVKEQAVAHNKFQSEYDINAIEVINVLYTKTDKTDKTAKEDIMSELTEVCETMGYHVNTSTPKHMCSIQAVKTDQKEPVAETYENAKDITSIHKYFFEVMAKNNSMDIKNNEIINIQQEGVLLDYKKSLGKQGFLLDVIKYFKNNPIYEEIINELERELLHKRDHDKSFWHDILLIDLKWFLDTNEEIYQPTGGGHLIGALNKPVYAHRTAASLFFLIVIFLIAYYFLLNLSPYTRTYKKIRLLNNRLNASLQFESGASASSSAGGFTGLFNRKQTQTYQPLDSKSIEILFNNLLKEMSEFRFFKTILPKPDIPQYFRNIFAGSLYLKF